MTTPVLSDASLPGDEAPAASSKLKDHPFTPWHAPASDDARRLCAYVQQTIEAYEETHHLRQRKRKADDQAAFSRTVAALVCGVLHHAVTYSKTRGGSAVNSEAEAVHISLSNRFLGTKDRYRRSPVLSKALPDIIERMEACGFLKVDIGHQGCAGFGIPARQTALKPTRLLIDLATAKKATPSSGKTHKITSLVDFTLDNTGRESILLRQAKMRRGKTTEAAEWVEDAGKLIPYRDNTTTRRYRAEMAAVNDWLAHAPIACGLEFRLETKEAEGEGGTHRVLIDPHKRFLWRSFTQGSFECGGRLWGGFWQDLSKAERLQGLTIAGERVCILDYGQMGPRLLYGLAGKDLPPALAEDCYAIPGYERCRKGIKKLFNAALFRSTQPTRFPAGTLGCFPPRTGCFPVIDAILQAHAPVKDYLFRGADIGHHLQYLESSVMVDLLLSLKAAGLPAALPVHDAVIVPVSCSSIAREGMRTAFAKACPRMKALVSLETATEEP